MRAPAFWWQPPSLAAYGLLPLGCIYAAITHWRRRLSEPTRLPVPLICVGNAVAGGAGKTPIVRTIAHLLAARGKTPHILLRGYGSHIKTGKQVIASDDCQSVGDEALMLAKEFPVWSGKNRLDNAMQAIAAGADILIMDDGFQNPQLYKNYSLLVVDGNSVFGNGFPIPAGPLREWPSSALAAANAVMLMGAIAPHHSLPQQHLSVFHANITPSPAWEKIRGQKIWAFAGIGRPEKFFTMLQEQQALLAGSSPFPDHHFFTPHQLQQLRNAASLHDAFLVTTEKDWTRLPPFWQQQILPLPIEANIQNISHFFEHLSHHVA
ncbi:MAG: tetraacyldisaccharide 4'-kinase [Alphaproteobacteria bacterium]